MFNDLSTGALVAAAIVMILREVFNFLKEKKTSEAATGASEGMKAAVYRTQAKINELHSWHDKEDDEGRKIWYHRKSLESAVEKLAENIAMQTTVFTRLIDKLEAIESSIEQIKRNR